MKTLLVNRYSQPSLSDVGAINDPKNPHQSLPEDFNNTIPTQKTSRRPSLTCKWVRESDAPDAKLVMKWVHESDEPQNRNSTKLDYQTIEWLTDNIFF